MSIRTQVITRELHTLVGEIVSDHAYWDGDHYEVNWHKLDHDDQNKIIALMVDLDGKDFLAIGENDENFRDEILAKLIGMTQRDDMESQLDFAESVKKAVRHYYEEKAIELVDELTGDYTHDTLAEQGLHLVQDRNHGDFIVQRI